MLSTASSKVSSLSLKPSLKYLSIVISPSLYNKLDPASNLYTPLKNVSFVGTKLNSK